VVQQVNEAPEGHDPFRPDAIPSSEPADPSAPDLPPVDLSVLEDVLADPVPAPGTAPPPVRPTALPDLTPAPPPPEPEPPTPQPEAEPPKPEFLTPKLNTPGPNPEPIAPPNQPETAGDPAPNTAPPPKVDRGALRKSPPRVEEEGAEPSPGAPQRILRRQAHLPANKSRKVAMSAHEIEELRALKGILLEKGIVTREELDQRLSRKTGSAEPSA
jgi:hypothetical protein